MSKHHNYRNYRQMVNPVDEAVPVEVKEDVAEVIAEAIANEEVDVDECAACDPVEVVEELPTIEEDGNEPLVGVVSGCSKLNIRAAASKEADVVTVVDEGTVVMIDYPVDQNSDWFKVYTEAGVEGFCMKQFVTVNN